MIPVAAPVVQYRAHADAIRAAIARVLEGGEYILGSEVVAFERAFADYSGGSHAVGVANGTDALVLSLRALGVGPGDEVITVSHTAVATVAAILVSGAVPVLVDVDEACMTLNPAMIDATVTSRTRAVIPVHLYGQAADLDAITAAARRHGLRVIEDCAQAAGGRYCGRRLGSIGDVGCFSFYPTKNLGAIGDGGLVLSADSAVAERVRRLRQYGWDNARETHEAGANSRLDSLQAAILQAKLPHLEADNIRRAAIAKRYELGLADLPLTTPKVRAGSEHAFHLYVVRCADRDRLRQHLAADRIGSAVHYPLPVHCQHGYAEKVVIPKTGLPVTSILARQILSLPIYPELSDAEVDRVVASIRRFYSQSP
ncbi:MAG: DegT/DnrJ/EryC1/StrS family aminotransferase [Xanthobacteraceae bacterium]|jgi:dTDP-4-amino-4,6-dideoxygalactose transaminase